jgi:hypothetical protein
MQHEVDDDHDDEVLWVGGSYHDRSMHVRGERKKEPTSSPIFFLPEHHPRGRRLLGRVWWIPRPLQQQQQHSSCLVVSSPQVPRSTKTFAANPDDDDDDDDDDITDNRTPPPQPITIFFCWVTLGHSLPNRNILNNTKNTQRIRSSQFLISSLCEFSPIKTKRLQLFCYDCFKYCLS